MKNSIRHKTPQSNLTQLLMQAQESKHLVERLVNLKPTIDNKQPKYFQIKPQKKAAVTPLRQREIEQENSHLLKKMLSIIQRKNNTYRDKQRVQAFNQVTSQIQNSQNQISAPDKNDSQEKLQYMDQVKHVNNHNLTQVVNGSLNYYQRKKELENINQNNKQMLKALKNTKPALKREDWTMHSRKHDLLMRHLQGHRHKSPPQTANMLLPVLNNSRVNRLNGDRGNPQSNRYTYKKDNGDLNESQRQYFSNENMNKTQISNSNSYRVIQKQDFPHQTSTNFNKDSKFQMPITPKVDKESSHQSPARNHQEEKEQSRPMTKSVPRGPHRYYDHVLQSPLMHLTNYPMSIVKRITSTRVVASERSTRRKSDSQGWQKSDNIVKMSLIDQPFLNEQTQQIDTHEDNYQNQDLVISSNQPVLRESKQSQRYTPQSIIKEVSRENKHKNDEEHSLVQSN